MADLLVRDVPVEVVANLKKRASDNKRSMQQELLFILEEAALKEQLQAADAAAVVRERLAGYGTAYTDSTVAIREDRQR
jgi:plasmid stability protein